MKIRNFIFTLLIFALMANDASAFNLDIGSLAGTIIKGGQELTKETGEQEEIVIGENTAAILLGAAPLVNNEPMQRYVNQVGKYLTLQTNRSDLPWHFGVLDTASVNAFATPGGHIFVTLGLMRKMSSESELAGVLSHEIAHVLQKHHLKAMKSNNLWSIAAEGISGQVGANVKGGFLGRQLSDATIKLIKEGIVKGLDKDDEYEADRMGIVIAARAGYDPYGLPAVLQIITGLSNNSDTSLLFKTHPSPTDRLDTLGGLMQNKFDHYHGQMLNDRYRRIIPISGKK